VNREFSRGEYAVRINWLIVSRAVLVSLLLVSLIFFQHRYRIYHFETAYLYYYLFSVLVLTAVYGTLLRYLNNLHAFAYIQTSGDILLVSILVYLTGGVDSNFALLYHLTIISASIILYRRGGYLSASLSSILYGGMIDMQYYNVFGFVRSQNFTAVQVMYQVFINIISFYSVAFLSSYLSERLRRTRQELREKSMDFDDLRVLQEHILRSVGSGILTMDLEGYITSWNPAAEHITGYSHSEIREQWKEVFGTSIKGLFGHTDDLKVRPFRFEGNVVKKNGGTAILGMVASLLKDERDEVRGIILIFQDITKMAEMEEQVRRQERLASVGSLAAGIAHEIRNPLASLSGSIQVLQGELNLQGDNRHLMEIVLRETDRLNTIITEFLEYARPRATQNDRIVLSSILEETATLLKNSRDFHDGTRLILDIDPTLAMQGDVQRVRQVFWNLLINACQSMPDGGEIRIRAHALTVSDAGMDVLEILISDTGQGIPRDYLDKLFDPFFTTKTGGTGLGLAIVYRIIEDYGGTIAVESQDGHGAQFTIRLPMTEAPAEQSSGENQTVDRLSEARELSL